MKQLIRTFGLSASLTLVAFIYVLISLGVRAMLIMLVLAVIELAFSFDNAVINAKVLGLLNTFWRKLFLSLGIIIAIFGVRLLLPLFIVGLTAHLSLGHVADLALHHPHVYAEKLDIAHPSISAFGGAFLCMLVLHFFTSEREVQWLRIIEQPLRRWSRWWLPLVCTFSLVTLVSLLPTNAHARDTFIAGSVGMLTYAALNGAIELVGKIFGNKTAVKRIGWAAFATFMYLELLDASLSFDGVIGAFAITSEVVLIALGLGVGAIWVRSLTVYMVRHKTLDSYRYLEHGAHYAIAILALAMLGSVIVEVPDFISGLLCLGVIGAAVLTSREALQRHN